MATKRRKRTGRRAGSFRTCAGCRARLPRQAALRLVRDDQGRLQPDLYGRLPGRGVHLCPNLACVEKAAERQAFSRAFRAQTSLEDPGELIRKFLEGAEAQLRSLLSAAMRAGWLFTGRTVVSEAIRSGRVALVLLAADGASSLRAGIQDKADKARVPCATILSVEDFSRLHRGKPLAVLGIRHRGIARRATLAVQRVSALSDTLQGSGFPSQSKLTVHSVRGKMPRQRSGSSQRRS